LCLYSHYFTIMKGVICEKGKKSQMYYNAMECNYESNVNIMRSDSAAERIAAGNRAFHVHEKLFTSTLICRKVKLQFYNTLIRPTVTYASETCVLKENMIKKFKIFERKVMKEIFGTTRSDHGYWRIKSNQEINDILK